VRTMLIKKHLPEAAAFEQGAIIEMSRAFAEACATLRVFAGDETGCRIVAARIALLAERGVRDAFALRDQVLSELKASA
jgi:hypothetical protein